MCLVRETLSHFDQNEGPYTATHPKYHHPLNKHTILFAQIIKRDSIAFLPISSKKFKKFRYHHHHHP